jgi:hypothetical protein
MIQREAVGSTGFWIFDDTLVALETPTANIEITQPQEIRQYTRMFEVLKASAVHGRDARNLIVATLNDLE